LKELREGLEFAVADPHIRLLIGLVISMSVFGLSFVTLIPAWAVRILGGDATTNGFLQSARGVGALAGALIVASLGRFNYRGKLLTAATFLFPSALIAFSLVRIEAISLLVMVIVGIGLIVSLNLCNSLVQTTSPDRLRGRIMGIYSLSFFGFMPLGGLLAGIAAEHIGEPLTVGLSSTILVFLAVILRFLYPGLSKLK
jgi:MFS family permease